MDSGGVEYHQRNLRMGRQPVGATGDPLGVISLVHLQIMAEENGAGKEISCFVLASEKPIWDDEVHNCDLTLCINALVSLGFQVTHSNGTVICPDGYQESVITGQSSNAYS